MSVIASKNLYELLGNTHDEDSDKEPEPPVKVIDKTPARNTKRNAPAEAPASKASAAYEGRSGTSPRYGNDGAFHDRNAGSANNRKKPTDEGNSLKVPGRGGRLGQRNFDRHSRSVGGDSEKQANHGWGANEGNAEYADEQAGKALAEAEKNASLNTWAENLPTTGPEIEPEDTSISYAEYILQQEEKKASLAAEAPQIRRPNEGVKEDKKWANAKPITKDEAEDFVAGSTSKSKRDRERRQKQVVEIDHFYIETPDRGGRGGFRGRGRGGGRGGRGDSYQRGGGYGGYGGSSRGNQGYTASINTNDDSAFPSLGS